ncbi:MAG: hypothetical protein A2X86_16670 [Bdellovibrionales bacterium GWA2_49_15]|nr:MAG: hypothetical protein A2X86_16670 [Bdellovibrionales bacterium GWA2_49_15]
MLDLFLKWYGGINKNKFGDGYSPHKPITLLFALTKLLKNERWINYQIDRENLEALIGDYTNFKSKPNCLQPLWRLKNDSRDLNIWATVPSDLKANKSGDISPTEARERNFQAGFSEEVFQWLGRNKALAQKLIDDIIDDNFPETLHAGLLEKLGVFDLIPEIVGPGQFENLIATPKRDPNFPKIILQLYDYRCCFCNLKLYFNHKPFPMEAAHIKWKARGGECSEQNGLSLCPTHHLAFDRGIWSLDDGHNIVLSSHAKMDTQNDIFFTPFLGKSITNFILDKKLLPTQENILWHRKNIFI